MTNSFYSHLVSILIHRFESSLKPADRYRIVLEEEEDRKLFLEAIKKSDYCQRITIDGIAADQHEEPYETYCLAIENRPKLLLGSVETANLDYLATMRNAVAPGKKYENDAFLCVLGGVSTATIDTTTADLTARGMPFSASELARELLDKVEDEVVNKMEKRYLSSYLRKLKEDADSHQYTIKDFKMVLDIVFSGSFRTRAYELKFFRDNKIQDGSFNPSDSDLDRRINGNAELFNSIEAIMHNPDAEERVKRLGVLFDETFALKMSQAEDDWFSKFDIDELIEHQEKKKNKKNQFDAIRVLDGDENNYNIFPRDRKRNKNQNVIVFDSRPEASSTRIELCFVHNLPADTYPDNCSHSKSSVKINLSKEGFDFVFDKNGAKYRFRIIRLPIEKRCFEGLAPYFKIEGNNSILIDLPAGSSSGVSLGCGDIIVDPTAVDDSIIWKNDLTINIPAAGDEPYSFSVDFGNNQVVNFTVRGGSRVIVPKEPLAIIQDVLEARCSYREEKNGEASLPFRTLRLEESLCTNKSEEFCKFLNLERMMIQGGYTTLSISDQIVTGRKSELPSSVLGAYENLCGWYEKNGTVPSLTYINKDLQCVIDTYISAVNSSLKEIPNNNALSAQQKNISKLGIVEDNDSGHIYLSPLHPVLACYNSFFSNEYNGINDCPSNVLKVTTPFYLMPYITSDNLDYQPYKDKDCEGIRTWLFYERQSNEEQVRINNITTKVVEEKIEQFLSNFGYLFIGNNTPLRINAIDIENDENVIVGITRYIKWCLDNGKQVQRLELREYVRSISKETFMEKLYRLSTIDMIIDEFELLHENLEKSGVYSPMDVVRLLLAKVSYYKMGLNENANLTPITYCHIAFYRMRKDATLTEAAYTVLRSEMSYNGLISQPSTRRSEGAGDGGRNNTRYTIGFGTQGIDLENQANSSTIIYRTAALLNELYSNAKNSDTKVYHKGTCLAKNYVFSSSALLENIYDNSNWVTFISPEVDLDFFYRDNLYIVYFTDQLTLGSRYDSITVTKQIGQYNTLFDNSLRTYAQWVSDENGKIRFRQNMLDHFNSMNGRWLLSLVTKTEAQVKEKISLVATSMILRKLMRRGNNHIWIPISLDEIVRVTGSIGLSSNNIFSKSELGLKGPMSDDLLFMGLDSSEETLKMFFYPVEVKVSDNPNIELHGELQVVKTFQVFDENLCGDDNFIANVYRSFFCNLFLSTADKMRAYGLIFDEEFQVIDCYRNRLQNLDFKCCSKMQGSSFGQCGLVRYFDGDFSIETVLDESGPAICKINIPFNESVKFIAESSPSVSDFIEKEEISISQEVKNYMEQIVVKETLGLDDSSEREDEVDSEGSIVGNVLARDYEDNMNENEKESEGCIISDNINGDIAAKVGKEDSTNLLMAEDSRLGYDVSPSEYDKDNNLHKDSLATGGELQRDYPNSPSEMDKPESEGANHNMRILLGHNKSSNTPIYFEPNNPSKQEHPNMGIIGTMGTGKTQLLKSVIGQLSKEESHNVGGHPIGQLIFDYKGDYNAEEFLEKIGGECFFNRLPFNPLKLFVTPKNMSMDLPAMTAERIADSLARAYNSGPVQQARIKNAIIDTYKEFGITEDPATWTKTPPTLPDVISRYLEQNTVTDTVYALFSSLSNCGLFDSDPTRCVSIFEWLDGPKIIDLSVFDAEEVKRVIVSLVLDVFHSEMLLKGDSLIDAEGKRELRAIIIVDEASQFLQKDFPSLKKILSQGRMFGVGMILSTQSVSDFKTKNEDYSQYVLTWAIHKVNGLTLNDLGRLLGPTNPQLRTYLSLINSAERFCCIMKVENSIYQMKDKPFYQLSREDARFN